CDDDSDRMCYLDGSVFVLRNQCPADQEALFDCEGNDYFHTAPLPGTYLASHWNTASSSFLIPGETERVLSIADAVLEEGDSGAIGLTFTVGLSPPAMRAVTVRFSTGDGTAASPGDYQVAGGTISVAIGESARTVTVAVTGDMVKEDDETFTVTLSEPVNARLGRALAVGTIIDNEPKGQGYWFVAADGGIFSYGDSKFRGSTGATKLNQPVVGMDRTATGQGYWLVARDGGIFSFGDAGFFGSAGATRLNQPIVGMTGTPSGQGYRFVAADGGIFSYGDAGFFGSAGGMRLSRPVVAMAATPTGRGYWLVTAAGAVYAFGDAPPLGSGPGTGADVVGMAPTPTGGGYWLAAADGALYSFGDAAFRGAASSLNRPIVGLASTPAGQGYWM
ncbi:MAG TPA: Calx-beta domain-containing protein, partial [Acidimicrobiales bacterium]|nr:Calx-beta domain-containing protein [Acidimicrobiales bacterium]